MLTATRSLLGALALVLSAGLAAPTLSNKPVHISCPTPPARRGRIGSHDWTGLEQTLGSLPVVENRPGAGGIIASQALAQSAPDGYTLILVASGHPLNQFFYPSCRTTRSRTYSDQRNSVVAAGDCGWQK